MRRRAGRSARMQRVSMPRGVREKVKSLVRVRTRVSPCMQPAEQLHDGQHTIADLARALRCNKKQIRRTVGTRVAYRSFLLHRCAPHGTCHGLNVRPTRVSRTRQFRPVARDCMRDVDAGRLSVFSLLRQTLN
ncbi:hypothetical protein BURMUCF2_A0759 [Burkholderia multivorans CF2]|nr:hypothetical protein BURMUCF2_A0759 [Burkholderia multivorans CF2]